MQRFMKTIFSKPKKDAMWDPLFCFEKKDIIKFKYILGIPMILFVGSREKDVYQKLDMLRHA